MSGYTSYDGYNYNQSNYGYNNSYNNYNYGTNNSAGGSSYSNGYNYNNSGYSNNNYGGSSSSGYGSYSYTHSNFDYNYDTGSSSSNSSDYSSSNNNSNSSGYHGSSNYKARSKSPPDPNRSWNFNTNPFTIIGITSEADAILSKIKKLYHLKILSCHPDKSKVQTRSATIAATEVTTAYNYLKGKDEPNLKRLYRQFQAKAYSSANSASSSSSSSTSSNSSSSQYQYQQQSQNRYQYNNYSSNYNSNNYNNYQYQQNWDYSKPNYSSGYSSYSSNGHNTSGSNSNNRSYSSSSSNSHNSQKSNSNFGGPKSRKTGGEKTKKESKMLRCNYCEKKFLHPYTLLEHENIHATGIECSVCKKAFTTVGGAKRHITIACGMDDVNAKVLKNGIPVEEKKEKEKKEPLFLCTTCGKGFNEFLKKVEHEKVHFSGIQCSSCRKQFVSVRGAKLHIKNICSKISYAPVEVLKNGAPITADDEQEEKSTKKKPEKVPLFLCTTCGKGFDEFLKKVEHEKLHFAGIQCSACKKEFINISGARRHISVVCGKETDGSAHVLKNGVPFTNDEIKKDRRPKKPNLWDWKPNLKSDTWKFSTSSMGNSSKTSKKTKPETTTPTKVKTETDAGEPLESKQQRRPNEKQFECHKCGKKFVTERYRSKHLLTHLGNEPFECSNCTKKFATRSAANFHIMSSCGMWDAHILKDGSPL